MKGVWGVEVDFSNGAGNFDASSNAGSLTTVGIQFGGADGLDLDTDVQEVLETSGCTSRRRSRDRGLSCPSFP